MTAQAATAAGAARRGEVPSCVGTSPRQHRRCGPSSRDPRRIYPVRALLHFGLRPARPASVHAQFDRVLDALTDKLPQVAAHLDTAREDILAFTSFPEGDLAADLVEQPAGAAEPGDPPPHRRRGHLPRP